ncbi:MAG: response regulator transcription factor [Chlorobi bacterium]|nr:response regulator transcription factor [Chlorobiota bacterium]
MKEIRLLIVDDHQIIIDGLKSLLEDEAGIRLMGEANNGKEALDILKLLDVDIVLMDIDMPIMNGIEATKHILKDFPNVKVVILSMHKEGGLIKNLISIGAHGFLLKNSDQAQLVEAIRKVASGDKYFSPEVTMSLLNKTSINTSTLNGIDLLSQLTERETEILKLIAEGFSNKEIGEKLFISHRTVDTHRTNLMKKLDVGNIAGLIKLAIQNGLVS